ncbi:MAG TPA: tyrosine-type recombinase/integrase [Coriobacteriia bacterium]
MAYLVQKKRKVKGRDGETREVPGNYYICWRDRDGTQRTEPTGTDKHAEAKLLCSAKNVALGRGTRDYAGGVFSDLWAEYMTEQVSTLSEASERNYRVAGNHYFCAKKSEGGAGWGGRRVEELTPREIRHYFVELTDSDNPHHRTTRRANTLMSLLSGFYSWLWENELVDENPVKKVKRLKNTLPPKKTISYEQMMLTLHYIDPRWFPHLSTLCWTGVRISELRGLTWESFSTTRRQLKVDKTIYRNGERAIQRTGKPFGITKSTSGVRIIPLPETLYETLMDWKFNGWHRTTKNRFDLMFPSVSGGPLNEEQFREAIRAAVILAAKDYYDWEVNFPDEELDPKTVERRVNELGIKKEPFRVAMAGCHLFRHGFARFALEFAHLSLVELQRIMGHASYSQTLIYAEFQRHEDEVDPRAAVLMDAALETLAAGKNAGRPKSNRGF